MRIFVTLIACLARASYGRRVQNNAHQGPMEFEALSRILLASKPDAAWQVIGMGPGRNPAAQKPTRQNRFPRSAAVRMEEEKTLEQQLKDGDINQEEYDLFSSAIEEDEYLEQIENEPEKVLSEEAQKEQEALTGAGGREYAPWMKVDPEAIVAAKQDRAARQKRLADEAAKEKVESEFLNLKTDDVSTVGGIEEKILSTGEVELSWTLGSETKTNKGFIVQRTKAWSEDWETLASWEETATLKSKGPAGGTYVYLDDTASAGNWFYRIINESNKGRSLLKKKMVEIESNEDAIGRYVTIAGLLVFVAIAYFAVSNVEQ
mmetsp:Transcript_51076/g.95578  ORF Transcript_51076/g.95578 Transcript_51076/m.95578 type:complete len:319 (+) Transcript_51076:63-1019(+)